MEIKDNNVASNNFSPNVASGNFSPTVNFHNHNKGLFDAIIAYLDYKKFKITVNQNNVEPLYHLVRKDTLTTQPKTKEFLERIFKKYENGDVKISLAALRVIEFMDDELYNILIGKTHNDELLHAHALIKYDYKVTEQRSFTSMGTLSAFGSKGSGYDYQIHTQTVKTLTFHELHKLITEK